MFTLAISCLTTSNLSWFMDLTFQVPMQYCSLQHQTLLLSPVTSTGGYCFCFGFIPSFFLKLFLHWSPISYWSPTDLGSSSFSILSFCLFILFMGFSRQEYWTCLPFPSPVDHILSDLSISCLTTPNLPWFMDLTFQVIMQCCSLQHQTLLPSPVTPTTWCCFFFGSVFSFLLELFLHWSPVAYWAPTELGGSSFSVLSICLFILFMGFSKQEYWSGLPFRFPADHILSELSTVTRLSWVALHGMAYWVRQGCGFIELDKAVVHVRRRRWHSTPVLLPGKPHGWRSLVGCSPWGH